MDRLAAASDPSFPLAELNDLLTDLGSDEFQDAVASRPQTALEPYGNAKYSGRSHRLFDRRGRRPLPTVLPIYIHPRLPRGVGI
ncbi:MAG TPA: hypothetical protein EYM39_07230 [Candidatus Latescibacteria bacterium]|nr:hypothetical protein [Candidatus Latescibacterota bacterium]HIM56482.1 hypothetical protein [Candidatus Latescibacterota bacterium]